MEQVRSSRPFHAKDLPWVYNISSKQNEKNEWIKATFVAADEEMLPIRHPVQGSSTRVAYEHLSFASDGVLTSKRHFWI